MTSLAIPNTGILAALLTMLLATSAAAQDSALENGLSSVPSNAIGFVHFDVVEMMGSPGMALPAEIAAGVQQEADDLFQQHLGVRISELQTVTLVAPTLESLMALQTRGEQTGFGLFAFASPVTDFADNLSHPWRPAKYRKNRLFVDENSGIALFQRSENIVAVGSVASIKWFIRNRDNQSAGGLRPAIQLAQTGQVTIGINGEEIPSEMKMFVPPEMKSLANAQLAAINLDFENGIAARVQLNFESEDEAADAVAFAQQNFDVAKAFLQQEESAAGRQLDSGSTDLMAAMAPLGKLAVIRFGNKILQQATIEQSNNELRAEVAIEGFDGQMMVLVCLSAVQAIGTAAEDEFQHIAEELNQGK